MKIVKSTETNETEERALVPVTEKIKELPKAAAKFFSANKKRVIVAFAAVLIIGGAIALNWILFGGGGKDFTPPDNQTGQNGGDNGDSYFAMAVLDRGKARDQAMEVFQGIANSADATEDEKTAARASIAQIGADIQREANIEVLVKGKGFAECVAVITGDKATVVVQSEGLLANELVQIWEIVYNQAGILPVNCFINEHAPSGTPVGADA